MLFLYLTSTVCSISGSVANGGGDIAVANGRADGSITNITNTTLSAGATALNRTIKTVIGFSITDYYFVYQLYCHLHT